MEKKKLLIYAHYYIPDTASTGQLLSELAEGMTDRFEITVICAVPSYLGKVEYRYKTRKYYEENIHGVKVLRIRVPEFQKSDKKSRVKNIVSYFFGAMGASFRTGAQDYVLAVSQPPILGGLLGVWGKWVKRARFIYNIQDFNPEQAMAVGYGKSKWMMAAMMRLDKFSCRRSDLIVTVGRDLVETVRKRFAGTKLPRTAMIPNWADEKHIYPLPEDDPKVMEFKKKYGLEDKFVIMYSGNLGLYYDLENLLKVIGRFSSKTRTPDGRRVAFVFVGGGSLLEKLTLYAKEHSMDQVSFIPYQDRKDLIYSLNAGDVHWCINAKGIKGVSCPSKAYGIMAVGKAIIGCLEAGSEVRCLIESAGSGLCCEPGEYDRIEENLRWFISRAGNEEVTAMGERGRASLQKNLSKETSIRKYMEAILNL